ncbi:PP2C family protein-serine/threonine phosphatase [Streptomyces sp. NPDC050703]|uniref:PP2C family protein-serine/threonine phosphatase n=1 Tax=Streptomyces sp. NPDC050703 TaxID=3157218 RepID=UPI0034128EFB
MVPLPPGHEPARSRLELRAVHELLEAQHERVRVYAEQHTPAPARASAPPAPQDLPPSPSGHDLLEAMPIPALLVAPVLHHEGGIEDFVHVGHNAAARAHPGEGQSASSSLSEWSGPAPLFVRFPALRDTALPGMLERACHDGVVQGPESIAWFRGTPDGPARSNILMRVIPCGRHLLITWEHGDPLRMALAAQKLVKTCWAEWNLGDSGIQPSRGFRDVLGLDEAAPLPGLFDLATLVTRDSLGALYQMLYDVILRKHTAECELHLRTGTATESDRVIRMVAEPEQVAPGALVWAVRAVLIDVTSQWHRRTAAEHAEREARRQRQRAETVAEVADVLREAVLPHFQGELAPSGLEAAVVYLPDATGAGVGGDWYKARRLPDGRLLVGVGDARGHGLDAVTLMAKLRYALAGLAYTEQSVEQLTQWLNEVACDDGIESTATSIIARYHPERALLRWTCAGHPCPVLLREGRATQLPAPPGGSGPALGVLSHIAYTAAETPLAPGDIVLFYSDGLVERRDSDPDLDTARLLDAVEAACPEGAPGPGHAALQAFTQRVVRLLDSPHRSDDATLLALRHITA